MTKPTQTSLDQDLRTALDVKLASANGKHWRLEGPGWTMQPIGQVSADEARDICERALSALTAPPRPDQGSQTSLWCMHIAGPDDLHAAPDFWTALAWAAELNGFVAKRAIDGGWAADDNWPLTQATVKPWPYSADEHGRSLTKELADRAAHEARRTAPPRPDHAGGVETDALVDRFATALKAKLRFSEAKHGWQDGWMRQDWKADCQQALVGHIAKGDPVDVAGYAAFCWHHGWSTTPAQAPDKAAEREGVDAEELDADRLRRIEWQMLQHGGVDSDDMEWMADMVRAALAPKPTGTGAGRGVGAERCEHAFLLDLAASRLSADGWSANAKSCENAAAFIRAATPTPPTPDSTAQGDGTSQEGTR